ncbi:GNAT family N-acetyltransferase [Paenibacillus spiritus]|uniref:GNAT family N-acetyltransferase n=1 Tax=Paenibacillus spiritus TaxID=2496557 RepID=A0A5J5G5K6_9BACL|nr:GNAT family N-acetyltransferase [Paenibacillus spiritus]KAA9002135.1 GNAT family N-acetyltransferase [Paenibacillus spiritus]
MNVKGRIEPLDLEDSELLSELWLLQHQAYRLEAERIGFHEIPPLLETRDMLRRCGERFYGYLGEEGELIGAVAVEADQEEGIVTVSRMMVRPDHFRLGIAGRLLEYVFATYPDAVRYTVSTGKNNEPAVALYRKHGFSPVSSQSIAPGVELLEFHRGGSQPG